MDIKKKAAIAAVMVYLEQEKKSPIVTSNWLRFGNKTIMDNRRIVQSRGRFLRIR